MCMYECKYMHKYMHKYIHNKFLGYKKFNVYVCMFVCINVHTHVCTYVRTHKCTHIHNTGTHTCCY